jgi:hypothetical protein
VVGRVLLRELKVTFLQRKFHQRAHYPTPKRDGRSKPDAAVSNGITSAQVKGIPTTGAVPLIDWLCPHPSERPWDGVRIALRL